MTKLRKYNNAPINGTYRGLTGSWTKWGGGRMNALQSAMRGKEGELNHEWACQSCGKVQPKTLTPYRFKYLDTECIRVCAKCFAEDCIILFMRMAKDKETVFFHPDGT